MRRDAGQAVREAIADHGPITFAEFMEVALYGPGGFYEEPPVGKERHFVTSPHVHPVFGDLLAKGITEMWLSMGRPDPFQVVEIGAGDGTLARQLLAALRELPIEYVAVERSAGARRALSEIPGLHGVAAAVEALDQHVTGLVLANEVLDNLPFHRVRAREGKPVQMMVDAREGRLVPVEAEWADPEGLDITPRLEEGQEAAVSPASVHLLDRVARLLRHGFALFIDYSTSPGAEVHGYRQHTPVEDLLANPGLADITAGVDFGPLVERARALGLMAPWPISQRGALLSLGFDSWMRSQLERQGRAQQRGAGREAVGAWSGRQEARLLVEEAALGDLDWLVLGTAEVDFPDWIDDTVAFELGKSQEGWMPFSGRRRRPRRRRSP